MHRRLPPFRFSLAGSLLRTGIILFVLSVVVASPWAAGQTSTNLIVRHSEALLQAEQDGLVKPDAMYTRDYRLEACTFVSSGRTPYFVLEPGYQMIFEGPTDAGAKGRWIHWVLDKTETLRIPGIGSVEVRAVDEKEWGDGEVTETSTAYYAICKETGDVYDFGDEVWVHNADGTVTHEGSWRAGQPDEDGLAEPGIFMPGTFLVGARYFQQMADGYSTERAENVEDGLTITTPAGTFEHVIKVFESNTLEADHGATFKFHAPGVGLLGEGALELVAYGFNIEDVPEGPLPASPRRVDRNISDERATEIALAAVPGNVIGVALERKLSDTRIVVEVIATTDMAETDVIIDRLTGEVLAVEQ